MQSPHQQQQGQQQGQQLQTPQQQQQQQQAQLAVSQAVQQAMQQRQGQPGSSGQALTDLAVNYMSAISAANYAKSGGAGGVGGANAGAGLNPALLSASSSTGGAGGSAGAPQWDPRLSYPTMMYMNNMNALNNMPNLLALQQQQRSLQQGAGGYMLDPNQMMHQQSGSSMGLDQRKSRHIKSPQQLKALKQFFGANQRPTKEEIRKLVKETSLPHQEVTRWFRNERHKEKKSNEAKMEAIQGHVKLQVPGMHPHAHMQQHNQHGMPQQQAKILKRKRDDGSDDSDTGSDGEGNGGRLSSFGLGNVNPPQRVAFIQSFIASLHDPNELDAAEKTLEAKRALLGFVGGADGTNPISTDAAWVVLQQQFHNKEDAKRRKIGGAKDVAAAAAAATSSGSNGLDNNMVSGLTQMFAKHPEYLKEVQKALGQ